MTREFQGLPEGYVMIKRDDFNRLMARIEELEGRLNKNSNNSSKPPSSDGPCKVIKNNREKSVRSQGAQIGHDGKGLSPFTEVDKEVTIQVKGKCQCGKDISEGSVIHRQNIQVIDLPAKLLEVTEYHIENVRCQCGMIHKPPFAYERRVQYGDRVKSLLVYMSTMQQIPCDRLQELTRDIFGISASDGLIQSSIALCSENLSMAMEQIKEEVLKSPVAHADETGIRIEGKTSWIHDLSTSTHTMLLPHCKRGKEAMDEIGLLPEYKGTLVHDRWASYDKYQIDHALCNAHLLRDLKFLHEDMNKPWALELKMILQQANQSKNNGDILPELHRKVQSQIEDIVNEAIALEQPQEKQTSKKRGRKKKGKALCLLHVFKERLNEILRFLSNPKVPFDNNLAERDIRMVKLKQKISGCFRSMKGANMFCRIRSYISTLRKQKKNVWESLFAAVKGSPIDLTLTH